jgi:hypothetical protein
MKVFPEALLHYLWKFRLFDNQNLLSTEGDLIEIEQVGQHNLRDAGPDFSDARIRINDTLWAGQVEIHKLASDWERHQHNVDAAYDTVVLHVVYEYDKPIYRLDGSFIPTLELKDRIAPEIIERSANLLDSLEPVACRTQINQVPGFMVNMWLERLVIERLEDKTEAIQRELAFNKNNWESTFYIFLARNFGTPVNAEPFEQLARSLPLLALAKHKNKLLQLEAMLFGQAGFLEGDFKDDYPLLLQREYKILRQKFELTPINAAAWKFGRMRPAAFPTIRIALFAQLIHQSSHLFSKLLETENLQDFQDCFEVKVSNYWLSHYRFEDDTAKRQQKSLGKNTFYNIAINTLVPFLFVYGKSIQDEKYSERALRWLEQIDAEDNVIIKMWKEIGIEAESAYQTQALLQLKKQYCDQKHCLDCAIGNKILRG